jgi:hypothetical protein
MRRILIPLAGLALLNVVGCYHLVMGKCDCDAQPVHQVSATAAAAPVAEPLKEMPKATPNE